MVKENQLDNLELNTEEEESPQPRPFWSGVIALGMVYLPVSLFSARRGVPVSLRMVDDQGYQFRRRHLCENNNRMLEGKNLPEYYPVEEDHIAIVEEGEAGESEPEKNSVIDLRRFIELNEIAPFLFNSGHVLCPDSGAATAYRLLAKIMAKEQCVGIATFVIRGREHLIAIMAEGGVLRTKTLQ